MFDVDGGGSIGLPEFEKGIDALGVIALSMHALSILCSIVDI